MVPGVEARAGVDTDDDGEVDQWSAWKSVAESYSQKPGFARIVDTKPARLDLSSLPAGTGFAFEYRTSKVDNTETKVGMESIEMRFDNH